MKYFSLYLMAFLYVAAGANHFFNPVMYKKIMPPWLGWQNGLVAISGVCEILLGLLLLMPQTRFFAAWGIIALLIAVFPANIQMAINFWHIHSRWLWLSILRLPLQAILIWWAYYFTKPAA
jgi:uncharacterized membrane protein